MNIVLWILQVLLSLVYFAHGGFFLFPPAEMVPVLNASFPVWLRLFVGVAEILAAIGLLLPGITRIMPILTAYAAAGLALVMTCAVILHLVRGEIPSAISGLVLLALAAFVAYGRFKLRPLAPRTNAATATR